MLKVISSAKDVNIEMNILALSRFLAEAVLLVTSRKANCCMEDKTPALTHFLIFTSVLNPN